MYVIDKYSFFLLYTCMYTDYIQSAFMFKTETVILQ